MRKQFLRFGVTALALVAPAAASAADLAARLKFLHAVADTYPPRLKDEGERKRTKAIYAEAVGELENNAKAAPNDAQTQFDLGDVYRIGHNLDVNGAWEQADRHLKRAMTLRPNSADAYLVLGRHYVNTDPKHAPAAFKLFSKGLELARSKEDKAQAYLGLGFASHFLGETAKAVGYLDEYLKLKPDDAQAAKLRATLQKRAGGAK